MNWFYDTSVWITLPVFVGGFVLASCLIALGLRPLVRRFVDDRKQWDRALAHVIGTFGVFFGILLALVAVSVYENYASTHAATLDEAVDLGALHRGTDGLPESIGEEMRDRLDAYVHVVINEDWPDQREGLIPEASAPHVDEFDRLLHGFEPETAGQEAVYLQLLATFDEFVEDRRERIDAVTLQLPLLFWLVIWVGAIINAVLIGLIDVSSRRMHVFIAGMLALFIGLVMFVTADMDHPYAGTISVGPGAFERVDVQLLDD
ncbi:DUF4239 domain-containing protein [Agromyces sp. LHK192]|uniref:bestrophin-like domain n=1 Tax=Agromyces sp. LHK192 TaxID=2498704 RepID=UPI0013E2E203|nr:DUF4239 domain-containing protein [Agromyces sp. LHK192]